MDNYILHKRIKLLRNQKYIRKKCYIYIQDDIKQNIKQKLSKKQNKYENVTEIKKFKSQELLFC